MQDEGIPHFRKEAGSTKSIPTFVSKRMASFIESNAPWLHLVIDNNIELNVIEPGIPFDSIPELSVESIPVQHREDFTDAFAFKITGRKTNNSFCA